MTLKRIYDDPNHRHYGPVRRLWVVLAMLYGFDLKDVDKVHGSPWDIAMSGYLHQNVPENVAHKTVLYRILKGEMSRDDHK